MRVADLSGYRDSDRALRWVAPALFAVTVALWVVAPVLGPETGQYAAQETNDAFGARLRDAVDLDHVEVDLLNVVQAAVQPAHATLWIRSGSR
jgi:hypothetical protein